MTEVAILGGAVWTLRLLRSRVKTVSRTGLLLLRASNRSSCMVRGFRIWLGAGKPLAGRTSFRSGRFQRDLSPLASRQAERSVTTGTSARRDTQGGRRLDVGRTAGGRVSTETPALGRGERLLCFGLENDQVDANLLEERLDPTVMGAARLAPRASEPADSNHNVVGCGGQGTLTDKSLEVTIWRSAG